MTSKTKKQEEKKSIDIVKKYPVWEALKEKSGKEFQGSLGAAEEIAAAANDYIENLIKKSIGNADFRGAKRIDVKDVRKVLDDMK